MIVGRDRASLCSNQHTHTNNKHYYRYRVTLDECMAHCILVRILDIGDMKFHIDESLITRMGKPKHLRLYAF